MITFTPLENLEILLPFIDKATMRLADETLGTRAIWGQYSTTEYAIFNNTLLLKETFIKGGTYFRFPIGEDVNGALLELENYTIENYFPLRFVGVSDEYVKYLQDRYLQVTSAFNRDYSDYIYNAQNFLGYKGKALSGQRNHLNKFKKLYPNYTTEILTEDNIEIAKGFLKEMQKSAENKSGTAKDEYKTIFNFMDNMFKLKNFGLMLKVDEKVIGLAVGEIVGDTLYEHIEKADKSFNGAYPTLASLFASTFVTEKVLYINREDDSGDLGLRTSKTQYKPLEIRNKNVVNVKTLFDKIPNDFQIETERLTLSPIKECDKVEYAMLNLDEKLNKFWGYDYREDLGENPTVDDFYNFQNFMKERKEEFPVAVKLNGKMVGELPLHHFDYNGGIEIGFRFFSDCQGKGYAFESANALINFVKEKTDAKYIKSRCNKQNLPSKKLITKLGLTIIKEDDTHYYFRKDL